VEESLVMKIQVESSLEELTHAAAELIVRLARESLESRGHFLIALSGGSTPKQLYSLLASPKYRFTTDWNRIRYFIGDERNVPPDSPESNYRMVKETLLDPLKIPSENVIRWKTELGDVDQIATEYEAEIERALGEGGRFDLVLLGLGSDAHTASLFPRTRALSEENELAVANWVDGLNAFRLTLTFPAINSAANVVFLVSGSEKARALAAVLEGDAAPNDYPAQGVKPTNGEIFWLIDEPAAQYLKSSTD
jgi:6-phosphogluconolactonase